MERPFADQRPLGPVASVGSSDRAEVNVYMKETQLNVTQAQVAIEAANMTTGFEFKGDEAVGEQGNVITGTTVGNSTSHDMIHNLKMAVQDATGLTVSDIEVVF